MRSLKKKAASQRGASITFALLLFLVCAVVSSVVIVAATAAGGRASQQAEMDERYYAVTAAAGRLRTLFEETGREVKLQYTKADKPENITEVSITSPAGVGDTDILAAASKGVLKKTATHISVNGDAPIIDGDVKCKIDGTLSNDGTLVFDINATTTKNEKTTGTYGLKLTFASTLKQSTSDSSETTASATVKWKLLSAEKIRSDRK